MHVNLHTVEFAYSNSPNSNIRLIATNIIFPMSNSSSISKNFLLIDELKLFY